MFVVIFRIAAWLTLVAIVGVTMVPIGMRPQLGFGPEPERVAAFLVLGLLFGLAYRRNWLITLGLVVVAGFGIETLQFFSLTRHPTVDDAVIKAVAGIAGVLVGLWLPGCVGFGCGRKQ